MSAQRCRKSSPVKQGPMRATIPMASLLRHNLRNSPTLSPTSGWRTRISPEVSASGLRSPGSVTYKAKSKTLSTSAIGLSSSNIRRTASLDAIYLKGQWPRESFYLHSCMLQVDKATQTDDNIDQRKSDDKLEKFFRQRLRSNKDNNGRSTSNTHSKASPVNIPVKPIPKPPMRNSIEGLNQEIERLVLKATGNHDQLILDKAEDEKLITPEGHRAPLADLLRSTRSVNTQTPAAGDPTGSCYSSGPPSRDSGSPLIPGLLEISRSPSVQDGSQGSSPEHEEAQKFGTSPHINRFLAREPPDGCEKVNLKFTENMQKTSTVVDLDYCPLKPCVTFELKPSLGSAFYPLHPASSGENSPPIVPPEQDIV